ncbi:MAG: hypothetical protein ABI556_04650, partial [Gemmatimonadales bacterium]
MAINNSKVLVGGLAAGVVMNLMDYVSNGIVFADRMRAESNAFKPGLGDMMAQMDSKSIAGYVIMDLVIGGLLVWTYAAMRPRFGPGMKTAVYVALAYWIFGSIVAVGYMQMGAMSRGLWLSFGAMYLVSLVIASTVGAWLYKEDA